MYVFKFDVDVDYTTRTNLCEFVKTAYRALEDNKVYYNSEDKQINAYVSLDEIDGRLSSTEKAITFFRNINYINISEPNEDTDVCEDIYTQFGD